MRHHWYFLLLTILFPLHALAQLPDLEWSEPMIVHQGDQDPIRPRIVLNGEQRPVVLWGRTAANFVAVADGDGFTAPIPIHPEGFEVAVDSWQGSDLAAHGNEVHAVMKRVPENTGGVYIVRSTDGGHSWGDTIRVDDVPGYKTRFSSVAMNGTGDALVQYMRIDMQETDHRYMVSRVIDGVVQPPVDVSSPFTGGEDCDCCPGQIVAAGDQAVALFRDATENVRVIWGAASTDGGGNFDQGAAIDPTNWIVSACPASGPDGSIDGDSLRYTWMSAATDGRKIYYGSAPLSDLGSISTMLVHPQPQTVSQNDPRIASGNGNTGVVWQQTSGGQMEILFAYKTPAMATMSEPDTVNVELAGFQRSPDIAYANGVFHIVWADHAQNAILYRTATLGAFIGVKEQEEVHELKVFPVPAREVLYVTLDEGMKGGEFSIIDGLGRKVHGTAAAATVPIDHLANGSYTLLLKDRKGSLIGRAKFQIER